jgi:hypothetical protein
MMIELRIHRLSALVILLLAGCGTTQTTSATSNVVEAGPPGTIGTAVPERDPSAPDIQIRPAEQDPTYVRLQRMLKVGPSEDAASQPTRQAISDTINVRPNMRGAAPGPVECNRTLCTANVFYDNAAAFLAFDQATIEKSTSPFNRWRGSNGHTGLLRERGGRLVARWYFMSPDAGMPRHVRLQLINKADERLKEARMRSAIKAPKTATTSSPARGFDNASMKGTKK